MSTASLWEIAIKLSIGKLKLPDTFANFIPAQIEQNGINIVSLSFACYEMLWSLPFHHRDPLDPVIISHSLTDDIPVVSADSAFDLYGVTRIW